VFSFFKKSQTYSRQTRRPARVSLAGIPSLKKKHITFQRKRSLLVALLLAGEREQNLIIEEGILHTCGNS